MKAIFDVKNPFNPRPLVFSTAMSAARRRALRTEVPVATSLCTGVPVLRAISTRTCVAPTAVNLMS